MKSLLYMDEAYALISKAMLVEFVGHAHKAYSFWTACYFRMCGENTIVYILFSGDLTLGILKLNDDMLESSRIRIMSNQSHCRKQNLFSVPIGVNIALDLDIGISIVKPVS